MLLVSWIIAIAVRVDAQEADSSGKATGLRKRYIEVPRVEARDESKVIQVEVQFQFIRLNNGKMRSMGFDVNLGSGHESGLTVLGEPGRGESIASFVESLCKNELATTLAEPTIATVTGRQADLSISKQVRLSCTPVLVDEERIHVNVGIMSAADEVNAARAEIKADGIVVFRVAPELVGSGPNEGNRDTYVLVVRSKTVTPLAASPGLDRR
jgi:hypothetical protein